MKHNFTFCILFFLLFGSSYAQELIVNGSFANNWGSWPATSNSNLTDQYAGGNYCPQSFGNPYVYFGDEQEESGVDNLVEGMYQQVSLPVNASSVNLSFKMSINTLEDNAIPYDFFKVNLLSANGAYITTLWNIDNSYGYYGIPGCSPWFTLTSSIPSTYFGQTLRLAFEATTDNFLPTIFRIDDISLVATTGGGGGGNCNYSLSQGTYVCPNSSANDYANVTLINTGAGCSWSAVVLSGSNWLATGSSGSGTGSVSIIVSANTSAAPRTGIISIGGQTLTVTQPGASCTYSLSSPNFVCSSGEANTYSSIALVNTQANCSWAAAVTSGNSWLACSSSSSGSGAVDVIVQANPTINQRVGTISIEGQVLTVTQPAGSGVGIGTYEDAELNVFPNPASEIIQIVNLDPNSEVIIQDISGKIVFRNDQPQSSMFIDISRWSKGLYLCRSGLITRKLVVN
jgi:hypothetical protein